MRNPERIDEFCELLKKGWHQVPDWRFGQLIENFKRDIQIQDLFYVEDDLMLDILKVYFGEPDITDEMIKHLEEELPRNERRI